MFFVLFGSLGGITGYNAPLYLVAYEFSYGLTININNGLYITAHYLL
jgi:hypothetical protein